METSIVIAATPTATFQHVTKASSDQLLSKFAELDSPDDRHSKKALRLLKRQKRSPPSIPSSSTRRESSEFTGALIVERKSLLPPVVTARRSSGAVALVKVGRGHFRSRNFRNRSIFRTIEKTWRRTIDGASMVFMEKQYNRHKRLLSDTTLER